MILDIGKAYRTFAGKRVVISDPGESLWYSFHGTFDDGRELGYYDDGSPLGGRHSDLIAGLWESDEPVYRSLTLDEMCAAFLANRCVRFAGEPWAILAVRRDRSIEIGNGASMTVLSAEQLARDAVWNDDETRCGVLAG